MFAQNHQKSDFFLTIPTNRPSVIRTTKVDTSNRKKNIQITMKIKVIKVTKNESAAHVEQSARTQFTSSIQQYTV